MNNGIPRAIIAPIKPVLTIPPEKRIRILDPKIAASRALSSLFLIKSLIVNINKINIQAINGKPIKKQPKQANSSQFIKQIIKVRIINKEIRLSLNIFFEDFDRSIIF
ncbi:MAG: hypothetical protein PHW73_13780 [Atribacterota bacterium]|nr:hypothetical protein [Atribacterota bacterium]